MDKTKDYLEEFKKLQDSVQEMFSEGLEKTDKRTKTVLQSLDEDSNVMEIIFDKNNFHEAKQPTKKTKEKSEDEIVSEILNSYSKKKTKK